MPLFTALATGLARLSVILKLATELVVNASAFLLLTLFLTEKETTFSIVRDLDCDL